MNRAAELMTGWIESRARGRPVGEVFRLSLDETGTPFEDPTARAIRERRPVSMSGVFVGPDAMRRLVSCRAAPIRDARGNVSGAVLVFADETKERELEAQVVQAQKLEAVGRLAGGIAHDYNNTLAVILGYVQLMEQDLQAEDHLLPGVRAIADAARRSAALTRQLLIFARRQVIAPVPLDLNASIASLEKILQRLVGEDITLRRRPAAGLWSVKIDPTQVDQILTNLCTNARDAIRDTGTITIETSNVTIGEAGDAAEASPGQYVCVTFRDTGEGMDRATRERIFEPFFTTKPAGRGTGLGMATVFGIVKQNNGFIDVSSEPGRGTTVRILLPRLPGDARVPAEPAARTPLRGTGTVLLVEDEPQLLQIVRAMLEANGYSVIPAATPRTALELSAAYDREIDLLLTDVVMPEMNGRELQKRLLALRPGMKALFMSGYATEVVAHRGIAEEGVPFIPKPFTPQGLMAKVEEVLGASVPE
jgi:signal transduction histidine kinase/CheY-like chemotaxis protein